MKVIAFDCFGTVFDLTGVPRGEVKAYIDHIEKPEWSPLELPQHWQDLPAHADAREGVERLRSRFRVVTCSNGPLAMLSAMSWRAGIRWDAIVPLEANRVFKPDPLAYRTVSQVCCVERSDVLVVTANTRLGRRDFGDVEAARWAGMKSVLIRGDSPIPDIIALAERLETGWVPA
jgi:2-haloacid dehalogenase